MTDHGWLDLCQGEIEIHPWQMLKAIDELEEGSDLTVLITVFTQT